jgi:hypothetical protein
MGMRRRHLVSARRTLGGATLVAVLVLAAGCRNGTADKASSPTSTAGVVTTVTTVSTPTTPTTPTTAASDGPVPSGPPVTKAGCSNGIVTDTIRAELVEANGLPGGVAVPGTTYFGVCGTTSYAVSLFHAGPDATFDQRVSFQDEGSAPRFFLKEGAGAWTLVGTQSYELPPSCATFAQLPAALKTLWQDCPLG